MAIPAAGGVALVGLVNAGITSTMALKFVL
jgi:hypothetical protein